jgi:hypothetical protein
MCAFPKYPGQSRVQQLAFNNFLSIQRIGRNSKAMVYIQKGQIRIWLIQMKKKVSTAITIV